MEDTKKLGLKHKLQPILPDLSNVYGIIYSSYSIEVIAHKIGALGWNVRKAALFDWELSNDFSEFILENTNNDILIHGSVSPTFFDFLVKKLKEAELKFELELYNENKTLIADFKHI